MLTSVMELDRTLEHNWPPLGYSGPKQGNSQREEDEVYFNYTAE